MTVRPIDGVVLVGRLPVGTPMVGADGETRLVAAGQGLTLKSSSWWALSVKLWLVTFLWGVAVLISIPARRHRRSAERDEALNTARRAKGMAWWGSVGRLPLAAAVVPPRPVFVPPPTLGYGQGGNTPPSSPAPETVAGEQAQAPLLGLAAAGAVAEERAAPIRLESTELEDLPDLHRWRGPAVLFVGSGGVVGWVSDPERRIVVELAAYLACHQQRPCTAEEIHAAVWPLGDAKRDISLDTVRQHLSRLRRALGEEHLPDAGKAGGYQLASTVSSDWFRFQALGEAACRRNRADAIGLCQLALGLVRGAPFAGVPAGSYWWAWDELIVATMEAAIVEVAHQMAVACMEQGWPKQADWAAGRGLLAVPTDEELLADRLRAAFAMGGYAQLERAWRDARSVLGEQATRGPLGDVYRGLRD
ncbi:MAG: AfsR/SARP family transcriptional regulator [Acidimicrobiales bacterium]